MTSPPDEIQLQLRLMVGRKAILHLKDGAGEARGYVDGCPDNVVLLVQDDSETHVPVRMSYPYGNIAGVGLLIG